MKSLIAIIALAASSFALAAPTTVYFAGTVESGTVVDPRNGQWVGTPVGHSFSGSITFDGSQGVLSAGMNAPAQIGHYEANRTTNGTADASIVSSFSITYDGHTYGKLTVPTEGSWVGKALEGPVSSYRVGVAASRTEIVNISGDAYYTATGRSLSFIGYGDTSWIGDVLNLEQLPDLQHFDPASSQIIFSNSGYMCAYVVDGCPDGAIFDEGSLNIFGRLTYLSMSPLATAEVPEPGSLPLFVAALVGLLGIRKTIRTEPQIQMG